MSIKASEISELIKQRIDRFESAAEARNVGTVVSVTDGITRIHGLADVRYGEMIEFPGNLFGVECAAIFAIFTSQAWNMAFSLYQSLKTVPPELQEAARVFQLSGWQRFWRLELPFAMPALLWNMMMSMSGGWFFVEIGRAHV